MISNITLSADDKLIEQARKRAANEHRSQHTGAHDHRSFPTVIIRT